MKFSANGALDKSILESVWEVSRPINQKISNQIESISTSSSEVEICYTPIVLPPDAEDIYPESFDVDTPKKRVYLSPSLSYEIFRNGSLQERSREYVRGIVENIDYASALLGVEDRARFASEVSACGEAICRADSQGDVR